MENAIPSLDLNALVNCLNDEDFQLPLETQGLNAYQWANLLEALTSEQRLKIWPFISIELTSSILSSMREDARNQLISALSQKDIEEVIATGSNLEVVEILDGLSSKAAKKLVNKLSPESQCHVETSLSYSDTQVGRYANPNVYTVGALASVADVLDEIKSVEQNNETTIFIVLDEAGKVYGEISIGVLLNAPPENKIQSIASTIDQSISDNASLLEASNLIKGSQRTFLPVLTNQNKLIGIFSIHDALSVFQEHYEAQVAHMGQVSDEDLFSPVLLSARRRAIWLGINLLTAFLASFVIGMFDKVLVEVVALAVLMPIVASMGGITGSQTLTLTIRGLATGHLSQGNYNVLRDKEIKVALLNGVLWSSIVAGITSYWFDNNLLSFILALSLIINMTVAAFAGILIPTILDRLKIDPALAGSVILTTVTDVVGFFIFLGGATIIFMY